MNGEAGNQVLRLPMSLDELRAVVRAKSRQHAELAQPLTYAGARRILESEHVTLSIRVHARYSQLIPVDGEWTCILDVSLSTLERALFIAHELGHLWLHHDRYLPRDMTDVYDVSPLWYDRVRELEADRFADLLMQGPQVTGDEWPRYVATTPDPPPVRIPPDFLAGALGALRWPKARDVSPDGRRVYYDARASATHYQAVGGRTWQVVDYWEEQGERVRMWHEHDDAAIRVFVNPNGGRLTYRFADLDEPRAMTIAALDRQFAAAVDERDRGRMAGD